MKHSIFISIHVCILDAEYLYFISQLFGKLCFVENNQQCLIVANLVRS